MQPSKCKSIIKAQIKYLADLLIVPICSDASDVMMSQLTRHLYSAASSELYDTQRRLHSS